MIINKWPALGQNSQFLKAIVETGENVDFNIYPKDGNVSVCKNEHWREQGKRQAEAELSCTKLRSKSASLNCQ